MLAKQVAEDWYLGLRGKLHVGELIIAKESNGARQIHPVRTVQAKLNIEPGSVLPNTCKLHKAMGAYAKEPLHEHYYYDAEQVYDYVLFTANTGLKLDEASHLEHRDAGMVIDDETGQRILEIEARGQRGVGHCKAC